MKPESSSAPLGAFFEPVRRRHPDVDLVVLADEPERPPAAPVDDQHVAEVRDLVAQSATRWWSGAAGEKAGPDVVRIRFGTVDGTVVVASRQSSGRAGPDSLKVLASLVRDDGGTVQRSPGGDHQHWAGSLGDLRIRAFHTAARGCVLEVESQPLYVGNQRARELVRH